MTPEERAREIEQKAYQLWIAQEPHHDEITNLIATEFRKYEERIEGLRKALDFVNDFCICERFKTPGFDYGETHRRMGRPGSGKRWITPKDKSRIAIDSDNKALAKDDEGAR